MKEKYNLIERFFRKLDKILCKIEDACAVGTLSVCGVLLLFGILNRVIFKMPLRWTEEACRILLVLMVFSTQPIVTRSRAHLKLAFLSEIIKNEKVVKAIEFIGDLALVAAMTAILILFGKYTINTSHTTLKSASMGYPMWALYGLCTLTFLDATLRSIMVLWDDYFSKKSLFPKGDDDFSTT